MVESIQAWLGDPRAVLGSHDVSHPCEVDEISPETMADVPAKLLRHNDWGEGAKIQYLGWLTRPGLRLRDRF